MEEKKTRPADRIKELCQWLIENKVLKSEFAFERYCGLSKHYIKNLCATEKGNVGVDTVASVYEKFPAVNLKWMVTGKGKMFGNKNIDELIERMRLDVISAEVIEAGKEDECLKEKLKKILQDNKKKLSAEDKVALLEKLL